VVAVVFWPIARALLRWLFADNHVVAKFIGVVSRVLPYLLLSSFYVYSGWLQCSCHSVALKVLYLHVIARVFWVVARMFPCGC